MNKNRRHWVTKHKRALREIHQKYFRVLKEEYGCYISGLRLRRNMATGVFLVPDDECIDDHSDLIFKRGKCVCNTGAIYIRESSFNEQVLVHEYIHRLSRNLKHVGKQRFEWVEGFDYPYRDVTFTGFNELLTEWVAHDITGIDEDTIYNLGLAKINRLRTRLGDAKFKKLLKAFFHSDIKVMVDILCIAYGENVIVELENMTKAIQKFDSFERI